MTSGEGAPSGPHPAHGQVVYLQLPAADPAASAAFYQAVFGWSVDPDRGRFEAPGIIGEWTTGRPPAPDAGPVVWILAERLWPLLDRVDANGGRVVGRPELDGGERYLVECDDALGGRDGRYPVVLRHGIEHPSEILTDSKPPDLPLAVEIVGGDGSRTLVSVFTRTTTEDRDQAP